MPKKGSRKRYVDRPPARNKKSRKGGKGLKANEQLKSNGNNPMYICNTPPDKCSGRACGASGHASKDRIHTTSGEALKCYESYLSRDGWTKIGTRAWRDPKGGPVLILNKKVSRAKPGKERYMTRGMSKTTKVRIH